MGDSLVSDGLDAGATKYFLSRFTEGELVWVKGTKETVWELGTVIAAFQTENDTVAVTTHSGRSVVTKKVFGGEDMKDNPNGYNDMTAMRFVNEPQILRNLETRLYNDLPYTFLGPVLVAVNPLRRLASLESVKAGDRKNLSRAHPYAIAELAYQQLIFAVRRPDEGADTPTNQTVIVSGESGAGKTVSSKLVLSHLVARSGGGDLADAIIGSNPVTESFGNSTTLRNPNSSRFGKMLTVVYDEKATQIVGATVGTYLLERSRITVHETGERNYHIFYELLQGADDDLLASLYLEREGNYKCLIPHSKNEKLRKVKFLDKDKDNFEAAVGSLKLLGFNGDNLTDLFGATAAVLHLSNVTFDDIEIANSPGSKVSDETRKSFDYAAELLGISPPEFENIFTNLERKVGVQVIKSPVSAVQATQLLEGVSRALYTRIFEYMVICINKFVNKVSDDALPRIGVLDIFGFETFQKNDLEQLLINYTNEALQLTFNKQVLEAEAALYEREKLAISEQDRSALDPSQVIDQSNKFCIDLLQGVLLEVATKNKKKKKKKRVPGILDVIHEQGRVPGPSEQKMLQKLHKTFAKELYPNYLVIKKRARTEFIVKHYAGKVTYTTGNFLLKNADVLPKAAGELFMSSVKETTRNIWDAGKTLVVSKKASIVSTFRQQIEKLNSDLNSTQCSFIRCIKPNAEMHRNEGWFNRRYTTIQLRNLSVPKTADVLKAGLPTRIGYDQLVSQYKEIFGGKVKIPDVDNERGLKSFIAALFYAFEIPRSCYKLGLTKVFFKSGDLDKLEEVLSAAETWAKGNLDATAEADRTRVINRYRQYYVKRRWMVIFAALYAGRVFTKVLLGQRTQKALELDSAVLIQRYVRGMIARKQYAAMLYAKKLEEERIAREKAEAERREKERLAEEARQRELEQQRKLRKYMEERKRSKRKQQARFAKMMGDFKRANKAGADMREQELEMKRQERARREAEEKKKREEAEKQRLELERLQKEREEQERLAEIAAEKERQAKQAYEEKLRREKEEAERKKSKADNENSETYINYITQKLERDQEKLEEKQVMEKVVEELLVREEKKKKQTAFIEEEEDVGFDDANPWFFYEDLDLDEIDNVSHDSKDEERINQALKFLETLADEDSDSEYDTDSDMSSLEDDRQFEIAHSADKEITQATFKDYKGPFIVHVHLPKLNENSLSKKKSRFKPNLQPWKQCFAFVYPDHQKVLLHHGTNTTIKVQFNEEKSAHPAFIKSIENFAKKGFVLYVTGARFIEEENADDDICRELIIAFQGIDKRGQFKDLLTKFLKTEEDMEVASKPKIAKSQDRGRGRVRGRVQNPRVAKFGRREDRRDDLRKQNYMKYALLKKAVEKGSLSKENVQNILLEEDDEDDDDDFDIGQVVSCISCSMPVSAQSAVCPHCGANQVV